MRKLTQKYLKELLYYNPETGDWFWLVDKNFSTKKGKLAGSHKSGYILIAIDCKDYRAHRLAFLYMTGKWPKKFVDHINGIRDDNRWENLREATRMQNAGNRPKLSNNKSGYKGVSWHKPMKKWIVYIRIKGKSVYLGLFDNKHEAAMAYNKAALKHFGEFAWLNVIEEDK